MEVHPIPIKSECLTLLRLYEGSAHSEEHLTEKCLPIPQAFHRPSHGSNRGSIPLGRTTIF